MFPDNHLSMGIGRAWLSEPAVDHWEHGIAYEVRLSVRERRARRARPTNRYDLLRHTHHRWMGEGVPACIEQLRIGFAVGDDEAVAGDVPFAGLDREGAELR